MLAVPALSEIPALVLETDFHFILFFVGYFERCLGACGSVGISALLASWTRLILISFDIKAEGIMILILFVLLGGFYAYFC